MMTHEIKIKESFADAVLSGDKMFEVRYNDRGYQKGDLVKFKVVDEIGCVTFHPLDKLTFEITYVLGGYGLKDGHVVFGMRRVE